MTNDRLRNALFILKMTGTVIFWASLLFGGMYALTALLDFLNPSTPALKNGFF